jgi:hypothetical protein
MLFDNGSSHDIMTIEEISPGAVADGREVLRGPHDVGKQDRCQRPIRLARTVQPLQELLDVPQARRDRFVVQLEIAPG